MCVHVGIRACMCFPLAVEGHSTEDLWCCIFPGTDSGSSFPSHHGVGCHCCLYQYAEVIISFYDSHVFVLGMAASGVAKLFSAG